MTAEIRGVCPRRTVDIDISNPFVLGRDGSRDEAIGKYRAWIVTQPALMSALHELRGKDLICWCAPDSCHAEVLAELVNPKRES
jgi:hypothetical protein